MLLQKAQVASEAEGESSDCCHFALAITRIIGNAY